MRVLSLLLLSLVACSVAFDDDDFRVCEPPPTFDAPPCGPGVRSCLMICETGCSSEEDCAACSEACFDADHNDRIDTRELACIGCMFFVRPIECYLTTNSCRQEAEELLCCAQAERCDRLLGCGEDGCVMEQNMLDDCAVELPPTHPCLEAYTACFPPDAAR